MQAMILTWPPQPLQISMSMLNTRFRRYAQVMAARRSAGVVSRRAGLVALTALGGRHLCTMRAVRGENAVTSPQVDTRLGH